MWRAGTKPGNWKAWEGLRGEDEVFGAAARGRCGGRGLDAIPLGLGTCLLALPSVGAVSRQAVGESPAAGILKRECKAVRSTPHSPHPNSVAHVCLSCAGQWRLALRWHCSHFGE